MLVTESELVNVDNFLKVFLFVSSCASASSASGVEISSDAESSEAAAVDSSG